MQVLIVAGEASGDAHAAKVARLLRQQGARIVAVGGTQLQDAGAELVAHIDELAVLGFVEVLRRLPRFVALKRRLETLLRSGRFDLFLPVDFPDLNLRLAAVARRAGVPVLYYIGPQVWAWRAGRLRRLRERVDHVALVLPFEKPLYDRAGVPATFVGHPLLDDAATAAAAPDVDLALFPGSRIQEVERHLPLLLDAVARLLERRPQLRFRVSAAPTAPAAWMTAQLGARGVAAAAVLSAAPAREIMPRARVLLVASGTATLEAALANRPFAVLYRTGRVNFAVARALVRVPYIALANLVAGEGVVREFVQAAATPAALAAEVETLLDDAAERRRIETGLARVRERLGGPGASARVAALALQTAAVAAS
jgi:lipid-A-disaccharide synthase